MNNNQHNLIVKSMSRIMNNQIVIMGRLCSKEKVGSVSWDAFKDAIHGTMDCVTDLMESEEHNND